MIEGFLAIEIGGTKLQLWVGDPDGRLLTRSRHSISRESGAAGIRDQIAREIVLLTKTHRLLGVGVGFGGPVDHRTGRILCSHQISGWNDFELASWLEALTGVKVTVDNDANVAALGEVQFGAGVALNPVFYATLGSGAGGGLVCGGQIYHGTLPGEVEFGHLRLDRQGTTLESRCSGWAIDQRLRTLITEHPTSALAQFARGTAGQEAQHLPAALAQGDVLAHGVFNELVADLAFGLSHVVHLLHPEILILGGGLSQLGEVLRHGVQQNLNPWLMEAFRPGPRIALSILCEDAVPLGAFELARRRYRGGGASAGGD